MMSADRFENITVLKAANVSTGGIHEKIAR